MEITIEKEEFYKMLKKSVKEAFEADFREVSKKIPDIFNEEMIDIIEKYGSPSFEKSLPILIKVLIYKMDNLILI